MKRPADKTRSSSTRTLLLVGVLASLCFSVGEGLRLLPITASVSEGAHSLNCQVTVFTSSARELKRFTPGPITLPVPAQKRIKRQQVSYEFLPQWSAAEPTGISFCLSPAREPVRYRSLQRALRLADRAPPDTI